jgi:hypothetical protein
VKQDDALNDISSILVELKGMAVDMGSEIEGLVMMIHFYTNNSHFVYNLLNIYI